MRRPARAVLAGAVGVALLAASSATSTPARAAEVARDRKPRISVSVGSGETAATALMAELYAQALEAKGLTVTRARGWTGRGATLKAMRRGQLDLYPDRTFSLLDHLGDAAQVRPASPTSELVARARSALDPGLTALSPSGAEDGPAIVCRAEETVRLGITGIESLGQHAADITFGARREFATSTPIGLVPLEQAMGSAFAQFVPLESAAAVVAGLRDGTIGCGALTTADAAIAVHGFALLPDDLGVLPDEMIGPVLVKAKATPAVLAALDAVDDAVDTPTLSRLLADATQARLGTAGAAKAFLRAHQIP